MTLAWDGAGAVDQVALDVVAFTNWCEALVSRYRPSNRSADHSRRKSLSKLSNGTGRLKKNP